MREHAPKASPGPASRWTPTTDLESDVAACLQAYGKAGATAKEVAQRTGRNIQDVHIALSNMWGAGMAVRATERAVSGQRTALRWRYIATRVERGDHAE